MGHQEQENRIWLRLLLLKQTLPFLGNICLKVFQALKVYEDRMLLCLSSLIIAVTIAKDS